MNDYIKVVVVGDNGVGKTRLVCARAYLQVKVVGVDVEERYKNIYFSVRSSVTACQDPRANNMGHRSVQNLQRCTCALLKFANVRHYSVFSCTQVLEKSVFTVDEIEVSLRMWDTFGDHHKDRRFAYEK